LTLSLFASCNMRLYFSMDAHLGSYVFLVNKSSYHRVMSLFVSNHFLFWTLSYIIKLPPTLCKLLYALYIFSHSFTPNLNILFGF
jgi:hypothetical protein